MISKSQTNKTFKNKYKVIKIIILKRQNNLYTIIINEFIGKVLILRTFLINF